MLQECSQITALVVTRRALHDQLDQWPQRGAQTNQSSQAANATALGALTRQKAQQGNGSHAPEWSVLDAEAFLQVLRHPAHTLQGLQQLRGFVTDFLTMHFLSLIHISEPTRPY